VNGLVAWAERTGRGRAKEPCHGRLRFAFYGRVSTEDYQDPVTSRARQRDQAGTLVAGHGQIVAEFFDIGQSRTLPWARRPQTAALVAALADPGRGWDAVVVGEYERAFYGSQYASMAPLFEHHGIQLWTPEVGGRIDFAAEDHEQVMMALGLQSKREITRTKIRVRTAMAAQTREQGRYLGGRPRWNSPHSWVISARPAHPALVSEADYIAVQDLTAQRGPDSPAGRRYLLAGLVRCGTCGRLLESCWSNGKAAYRCRHGHTSATRPDPARPKNAYIREDQILPRLPALACLFQDPVSASHGAKQDTTHVPVPAGAAPVIGYLRASGSTLTYDPNERTLRTSAGAAVAVTIDDRKR